MDDEDIAISILSLTAPGIGGWTGSERVSTELLLSRCRALVDWFYGKAVQYLFRRPAATVGARFGARGSIHAGRARRAQRAGSYRGAIL